METNDFENALGKNIEYCNEFFKPWHSPFQITNKIPYLLELLLDIYCEKKPFYQISRNKLFENVEHVSAKNTLKKYYGHFRDDLKLSPRFKNCTFDFLFNSYIKETKNGKDADKLYTYNDCVLGIIIGNWKYMPFNPRNLSSTGRFGNKDIPTDKYSILFELNKVNDKNLSNDFDKLVYMHLTDHYFNINLLCQFINFSRDWGIREDYGMKRHGIDFMISAIIVSALCQLPSWNFKYFFWYNFEQSFKNIIRTDMSITLPELSEKIATDICNFSLVDYPLYKSSLKEQLCTQLNVDDEVLLSYIKNYISPHAKELVNLYPDYSIEFMESIRFINNSDKYLITQLTKELYSIPRVELQLNDEELTINTPSTTINNYYQKVNEIVRYRIRKISLKSI